MTEQEVREIFVRHYKGGDLNEEIVLCLDEISFSLLRSSIEAREDQKDLVEAIIKAKSRLRIFLGTIPKVIFVMPSYIQHIDYIRESILKVFDHLLSHYPDTDPWFKDKFTEDHIKDILAQLYIANSEDKESDTRNIREMEMRLYEELFNCGIIALFGKDLFSKYALEFNQCIKVLRQCQQEAQALSNFKPSIDKAS